MYNVRQFVINEYRHKILFSYCNEQSLLACNLYNASLFRIRQIFTGWDKPNRSDNENQVFGEVALLESAYPSIKVKRVISYTHLEKLMRVTANPDFFAGLPMQTAQAIVKAACQDFKNWLTSLKDFKAFPEKYLGKPKMPHYKKSGGMATFTITNQDAVIYDSGKPDGSSALKLPKIKERLDIGIIPKDSRLAECKVTPHYGRFIISITLESDTVINDSGMPNIAAIDFGSDNIAAIVSTDLSSRLYKGNAILSRNQFFAKCRASLVSKATQGKKHYCPRTRRLDNLSFHHDAFNKDQCHKISKSIINYCIKHRVGTLILGVNKNMKQNINIGKRNNQLFYGMPLSMLRQMIQYKAAAAGIDVCLQEESYTSKADFTAMDHIPVYGKDDDVCTFSGKRIKRGLYRCHDGRIINADLNGAANILRKAVPDTFKDIRDYGFLNNPEVLGFHELNPQSIPVKRIEAA